MRTALLVLTIGCIAPNMGLADAPDATNYEFEDDLVQGDLIRPDGEVLHAARGGKKESLVRVREHFIDQLLKSIERL